MTDEQTARAIVDTCIELFGEVLSDGNNIELAHLIVAALAAERERCATIAEEGGKLGQAIAAAIRKGDGV